MTRADYLAWLVSAANGSAVVYHTGGHASECDIAGLVWQTGNGSPAGAPCMGLVALTQRRVGEYRWDYVATKIRQPSAEQMDILAGGVRPQRQTTGQRVRRVAA